MNRVLSLGMLIGWLTWSGPLIANEFAPQIRQANLRHDGEYVHIQTQIDYQLSPVAKEALHKGIALNWTEKAQIRQVGPLQDSVILEQATGYRLRYHALLNQYEVVKADTDSEMFLTLNVALGYLSAPHDGPAIAAQILHSGHHYKLAIKCQFEREQLPVPLRPFAYLDTQWSLSTDWQLWPIQK